MFEKNRRHVLRTNHFSSIKWSFSTICVFMYFKLSIFSKSCSLNMKALGKYNNLEEKLEIGCASFGQIREDARSE